MCSLVFIFNLKWLQGITNILFVYYKLRKGFDGTSVSFSGRINPPSFNFFFADINQD